MCPHFVCFSVPSSSRALRSSAVDPLPVETVARSEISTEDVDVKETAPAGIKEVKTAPTPVVVQPPHTSPKPSFAGEVRLGYAEDEMKK